MSIVAALGLQAPLLSPIGVIEYVHFHAAFYLLLPFERQGAIIGIDFGRMAVGKPVASGQQSYGLEL